MDTPNAATVALPSDEQLKERVMGAGRPQLATKDQKSTFSELRNAEDVIRVILSRARYASSYRRPFEEEWHRSFLAMFQVFSTDLESSWQSQRYMPLILSNVETAHSVIGTVVIDGQKLARYQAKTPEGRNAARAHEDLLDWQNKGPCKYERTILDAAWWGLVTGTAILDSGWDYDEQTIDVPVVKQGPDGKKVKVVEPQTVEVKDWPYLKELNPLDVYLCPHSGRGTDHEWVIMRVRTTLGDVRSAAGKGHIDKAAFDKWVESTKPTDGSPSNAGGFDAYLGPKLLDSWLGEVGKNDPTDQAGDDEDPASDDKLVELLVYRSKSEMVTLGSDSHLIGYSKNPYTHRKVGIVTAPFIPIKGCPYGRGLAGVLLGHQELLNANVNIFADVLYVSMMRPVVVDRSLISVLDDEAIFEPNAMLRAKGDARNAIVPLDIPAPSNLFMLWDSHLKKDADDAGGFTEQARGIAPANSPTATEFSGVQANIQNRLKIHVLRMKWFVEDTCDLIAKLNTQFYTKEQVISVVGESGMSWRKLEPWELVGDIVCQATTSPKYANADLHVQRLLQILQILMPMLQSGQMNPTVVKLLRGILRAANVDDVDEILPAGMETVKSWQAENQLILGGGKPKPTIAEVRAGFGMAHIQGHQQFLQEYQSNLDALPEVVAYLMQHIEEHAQLEQQFGQIAAAMAQGGQMSGAQTAGDPTRQGATALGGAQGSGGIPGESSPGPAAPSGRPMGG